MLQIIRKGDKTTHGGSVLTASETMKFGGIGVARKGDKVSCPIPGHGPTTIIEGNPDYLDHGIPVAFHGHKCACGCTLISSFAAAKVA
ncbi:PAAR domain-containing protein [Escherichia coli]|uniref:PAAR domain-containing protein n=5 Tax=Enterobacteriaceae TaxID=543 RepID=A0A3L5M2U5_ECOLX|nr:MULTISPECIES: PAAR domain-containing protein [Enterobacteriaceae]EFA4125315.1 PAAR domain-containing protein [Escherichia coli O49:H9]MBH5326294.1 PAAR domain-containing protein [Salmonella enterica]HAC6321655.1 PAAR domain-containing protein [Salmonella enterica subsp. enterica serovar Typhimurium]HAD4277090.1 PAAR domain-containing protein [Salmonella enterica subsp. enterica serovar Typhi str. CT18]EAC1461592.1 PAAR domain-containing protein [Escherichia coli]